MAEDLMGRFPNVTVVGASNGQMKIVISPKNTATFVQLTTFLESDSGESMGSEMIHGIVSENEIIGDTLSAFGKDLSDDGDSSPYAKQMDGIRKENGYPDIKGYEVKSSSEITIRFDTPNKLLEKFGFGGTKKNKFPASADVGSKTVLDKTT